MGTLSSASVYDFYLFQRFNYCLDLEGCVQFCACSFISGLAAYLLSEVACGAIVDVILGLQWQSGCQERFASRGMDPLALASLRSSQQICISVHTVPGAEVVRGGGKHQDLTLSSRSSRFNCRRGQVPNPDTVGSVPKGRSSVPSHHRCHHPLDINPQFSILACRSLPNCPRLSHPSHPMICTLALLAPCISSRESHSWTC